MLNELTIKNFRKHENRTINFVDGLNIIKAGNEEGKTTLMEAVSYNWFGSSALRGPLADVVSDPKWCDWLDAEVPVSKLFTQTKLSFKNTALRITRSSKGAELYENGEDTPKVTGHKEVTAYMEDLFGIPSGKASALIIAEQGDIRGVLSKGATDTSKFIEDLANFSEIDELVSKVASKVSTGSNALELNRVEVAEEASNNLEPVLAMDMEAYGKTVKGYEEERGVKQAELKTLNRHVADAQAIVDANKVNDDLRSGFVKQISEAKTALALLGKEPGQLVATVDEELLASSHLRAIEISDIIALATATAEIKAEFDSLPTSGDEWDAPLASLEAEIESTRAGLITSENNLTTARTNTAVAQASLISGATCPTCGTEPDQGTVDKHNADVALEVQKFESCIVNLEVKIAEGTEYLHTLNGILAVNNLINSFHIMHPNETEVGPDVKVPVDFKCTLSEISTTELIDELESLEIDIAAMEKLKLEIAAQQKVVDNYFLSSAESKAKLSSAEEAIKNIPAEKPEVDVTKTIQQACILEEQIGQYNEALQELAGNLLRNDAEVKAYEEYKRRGIADVLSARKALEEKDLANLLMKDIRLARSRVADKIWGTVLTVVSNYFTKMRGDVSKVTRGEKTFLVNGKSIKGLSGSTLDILGLAFRIAQSELFLSGVPILCLDEACAACDDDRSNLLIGLLGAATDKQVILIDHGDISPDVCDNLIELEG